MISTSNRIIGYQKMQIQKKLMYNELVKDNEYNEPLYDGKLFNKAAYDILTKYGMTTKCHGIYQKYFWKKENKWVYEKGQYTDYIRDSDNKIIKHKSEWNSNKNVFMYSLEKLMVDTLE